MQRLLLSAMISTVLLAGCQSIPTQKEITSTNYGTWPVEYEDIVKQYYRTRLKDPDSVRYENFSVPKTMYLFNRFSAPKIGYLVCVSYNAKNSYGAYTGIQTDGILIHNGVVIEFLPKGKWFASQGC